MGTVTLPNLNQTGTNAWEDVEGNDRALRDVVNGSIDADNLAANAVTTSKITDANVTDAKLASPNNSVYRTLLFGQNVAHTDLPSGTYILGSQDSLPLDPLGSGDLVTANTITPPPMIYFDDADYTVGSKTQKLRLRAQVCTNGTAWSSVTATFGLYPCTFGGNADNLAISLGTVVSGSTVAIANPSASSVNQDNSGDFTIPSDGQYALGVVISATLTNSAAAVLVAQLQTRSI